jgi:maltose/moltooligosaccharide transporter
MSTQMVDEVTELSADDERRPLMTTGNMAWMNLGFFGVQFSFGLTQTAVNPLFLLLGADAHSLPILNIAGPITGLLIQPFIGAMSDKTWSPRWGRRKPFVLLGGLVCVIILVLFPLVSALWMAVLCLWLVDARPTTPRWSPYRRADLRPASAKIQIPQASCSRACSTGARPAVLANLSLYVIPAVLDRLDLRRRPLLGLRRLLARLRSSCRGDDHARDAATHGRVPPPGRELAAQSGRSPRDPSHAPRRSPRP